MATGSGLNNDPDYEAARCTIRAVAKMVEKRRDFTLESEMEAARMTIRAVAKMVERSPRPVQRVEVVPAPVPVPSPIVVDTNSTSMEGFGFQLQKPDSIKRSVTESSFSSHERSEGSPSTPSISDLSSAVSVRDHSSSSSSSSSQPRRLSRGGTLQDEINKLKVLQSQISQQLSDQPEVWIKTHIFNSPFFFLFSNILQL